MGLKVVFFDMDHTLMDNDCDVSWKDFLIDAGLADPAEREEKDLYYRQYLEKRLNVGAFLKFQLRQFAGRTPGEMSELAQRHFVRHALPNIYPAARAMVNQLRELEIPTAILSSTPDVIAMPVAAHLGIDTVLATRLALRDGRYTGEIVPPYCLGAGKLYYAAQFCERHEACFAEAAYYGDSVNDIPMLEAVGIPVAVNPGAELLAEAQRHEWSIEWWKTPRRKAADTPVQSPASSG